MEANNTNKEHILQKMKILLKFDIVSSTSLEDFMEKYKEVAESSDNISELPRVSKLLQADTENIPGFVVQSKYEDNPELNKIAYALIEFILNKTSEPSDWSYILNRLINKLGLEVDEDMTDDSDDDDIRDI